MLFNIAIPFVFVAILLSCVVNTTKCDANVLLCPVISELFELILLKLESSLIVFADIVGSIEVMVNPCAVILLKLLVIVAF